MVAAGDHAETPGGRFMQMDEPARVLFLVNQNVIRLRCAQAMTPDLHRAMVIIELDVKEAVAVQAPHHAAVGLFDDVVAVGQARPVAHAN